MDWTSIKSKLPPEDTTCLFAYKVASGEWSFAPLRKYHGIKHKQYTHWAVINSPESEGV